MKMLRFNRKTAAGCGAIITALALISSSGGINNRNGAPGETTCNTSGCHNSFPLNSGGGSIAITDNIPATGYVPGQTYSISVTVSKAGHSKFGFGFEAVTPGLSTAGTLLNTTSSTYTLNGIRQNITHVSNGGIATNAKTFTFNWIAPSTAISTVTFFTAGNATNNNGNTLGDYIYTTTKVVSVTPLVTGNITGSPLCAGSVSINVPYTATGPFAAGNIFTAEISDANGSFANATPVGSVTATASGTIVTNVPLPFTAGTGYRIRVKSDNPVYTGTESNAFSIALPPTPANAGTDQSVCGNTAVVTANTPIVGTGSWSLVSGAGVPGNPGISNTNINSLGIGNNVFAWTISNSGCPPSTSTVNIYSAIPPGVATAGPTQTVCNDFVTLTGNQPAAGTGTWTILSGGGTIQSPNSPTTNVTNLPNGVNVFEWTISNPPCAPTAASVAITFSGTISIAAAGPDQTICATTATITANTPTAGTGIWSVVSGSGNIASPGSETTTVSGLAPGVNIFRWTITNGPCTPTTDDIAITTVSVAPANAGLSRTLCVTSTTLAANNPQHGTGAWSVVSGGATIANPSSFLTQVTGLTAGANMFVWTISNAPCVPSTSSVTILQSGNMSAALAGNDQTVCASSATLAANLPSAGSGMWTVVTGNGNFANPTSFSTAVSNIGTGNNVYRWTISSGTCTPSTDDVVVTGVPVINANAGVSQQICNSTTTLTGNSPASGTGIWSLISGTGTIVNPNSATTQVTALGNGASIFRWTIINAPCPPTFSDVQINNCNAPALSTDSIQGPPFCAETSYLLQVPFTYSGSLTGFFTAQLSDSSGSFALPVAIGSGTSSPISALIPSSTPPGNGYRIRVINSQPPFTGSDNGADISINTCNPFVLDTLMGSPFCASTSYSTAVHFETFGTVEPPYIAELSDENGSFAKPRSVGYGYFSPIQVVFPSGLEPGAQYRLRLRAYFSARYSAPNNAPLEINSCGITALEKNLSGGIRIYPTYTSGEIFIETSSDVLSIDVSDLLGKNIPVSTNLLHSRGVVIDLSALAPDVYILSISTAAGVQRARVIRQ